MYGKVAHSKIQGSGEVLSLPPLSMLTNTLYIYSRNSNSQQF